MGAISSIEIENFRCFKKLRVEGLAPVNLIVGRNNSGKTALLEAIEAVVSEESPFLLYRASLERGEFRRRRSSGEDRVEFDISHWFGGHRIDEGATFRIRATGAREIAVSRAIQRVPTGATPPFVPGGHQLTIERKGKLPRLPTLPLIEDGFLGAGSPAVFALFGLKLTPPVGFVTTDRLLPSELARLWGDVVLTPGEQRTVEALQLVEPGIDRVAVAGSESTASAKVLVRGSQGPVPLGTLGEGVSRMLALALHLALTPGGYLLIDEIENGLHWSIMPKLWRFLVETAQSLDVQVFATTHSKDCLEGLAELQRTAPALGERVAVHRLEAGQPTSVRFDAARVAEYLEMELETR